VWTSPDGLRWVREPVAAVLGGPGDQVANVVMPIGALYLFGYEQIGDERDAAVWVGRLPPTPTPVAASPAAYERERSSVASQRASSVRVRTPSFR
jgi:hypothetical protein